MRESVCVCVCVRESVCVCVLLLSFVFRCGGGLWFVVVVSLCLSLSSFHCSVDKTCFQKLSSLKVKEVSRDRAVSVRTKQSFTRFIILIFYFQYSCVLYC